MATEVLRQEGNDLFKRGDYRGAADKYTEALKEAPDNATLLSNRSAALMQAFDYPGAYRDASQANRLAPGTWKTQARLAKLEGLLGRPREALSLYSKLTPPPSGADLLPWQETVRNLNQAQEVVDDQSKEPKLGLFVLDSAQRHLGRGVPVPVDWQVLRVGVLIRAGRFAEAESLATILLRQDTANPDLLVLRGRLLLSRGTVDSALVHFQQALRVDPDHKNARTWLKRARELERIRGVGNDAFRAGRHSKARDAYTQAAALASDLPAILARILSNRATTNQQSGNLEAALSDADAALEADPEFTKPLRTKARILGALERWEEAVQTYKDVISRGDSDSRVQQELNNAELELAKSKRKDHYKTLDVHKTATSVEIKKAYRKMALRYHPDKNQDDEGAAEKFKEVGEAYEILSNEQSRARYDSGADIDMGGLGGGGFRGGGASMDDMMAQMFGGGAAFGGGGFSGNGFGGNPFGQTRFSSGGFGHGF